MKVIILAAGKGIRLNLDVPKVLAPLCGMTMIEHVVENVLASGVDPCPIVVIGHESGRVAEVLKDYSVQTVYQAEQLGTGHAVMTCELAVNNDEDVLVIGGDHPLISPEIIKALCDKHQNEKKTMTFVTYEVPDFDVHGGVFNSLRTKLPEQDAGIAALVADLKESGKIDDVVLVWMGEFGRTPRINGNTGRDHWANSWSVMIGGGGLNGGLAVGKTNADGNRVVGKAYQPGDVWATVAQALGIPVNRVHTSKRGRPMKVANGGTPIKELIG